MADESNPTIPLPDDIRRGVKALLAEADAALEVRFQETIVNPLLRRLRRTRLALAVVVVVLAFVNAHLLFERPTSVDLAHVGSKFDDNGTRVYLETRLYAIERWQGDNTITSPLNGSSSQRIFDSLQSLLTELSDESVTSRDRLEGLESTIKAMVLHLDCFTERTSDAPDDQDCYDLTCTLGMTEFTYPHHWDQATSTWSPCD